MPLTTPVALTDAMAGALVVQEPPVVALDKAVVAPGHTLNAPVIAATEGVVFTLTVCVTVEEPQPLVTV
jgi:hypothetical protein